MMILCLKCNEPIDTRWFCEKCKKKNKRVRVGVREEKKHLKSLHFNRPMEG